MIEQIEDFEKFKFLSHGDWIVHAVPLKDNVHPCDNSISILFIRVISTKKTYYYAFNHPDSIPTINKTIILNWIKTSSNIKWAIDKKSFCQLINLPNVYDANFCLFLEKNEILNVYDYDTVAHNVIRRNSKNVDYINGIIPLMKHLESFNEMCISIEKIISPLTDQLININTTMFDSLGELEMNGIYVDKNIFSRYFSLTPNSEGIVFSQYNLYTSTGRPSNRFGGVNYAALNSTNGCRNAFISRYGNDGKIVVIDYITFHPRIVCMLTGYKIDVNINIYTYLAKLYFRKELVDEFDISESKKLTFRQFYGGVEQKYAHIKYLSNLKDYIYKNWNFFTKNGYVLTPIFKRKITDKHIIDPNPAKVFNYILQAVEGEIAISQMKIVLSYLRTKKTKAILYTYDSLIFDFHKEDGIDTLNNIRKIMSLDDIFPLKTYVGDSYQSVKQI